VSTITARWWLGMLGCWTESIRSASLHRSSTTSLGSFSSL